MAGLCWMAVTLAVFLSTENSLADVDQNQLATLVQQLLNKYRPSYSVSRGQRVPMFGLAVSVPYNGEMYDMNLVPDSGEQVRNESLNCEVYNGTNVVAAIVLRWPDVVKQCPQANVPWPDVLSRCPEGVKTWADVKTSCPRAIYKGRADHAEFRILQRFNTLVQNHNENDFLLFYVLASPCDGRCTNETNRLNILDKITEIKKWTNYALVFSDVFKPRGDRPIPEGNLHDSVARLGTKIGLNNIYRCNVQGSMQCTGCSNGGQVRRYCYSDNEQSAGWGGG